MIEINSCGYRAILEHGKIRDERGREITRETYVHRPGFTSYDDLLMDIRKIPLERLEAEGFQDHPA